MEIADSHCHLDDAQFGGDRSEVIERARQVGVTYMLAIGTGDGPPDLEAAVRIAETYPFVFATIGVHPNDCLKVDETTFPHLRSLARHPKVKAIGEIGLDSHWGVPKDKQVPVFLQQLQVAKESGLPIVIHTRDAWDETLALLRDHWSNVDLPCVMHCFTGNADQARECSDLGFYLAFGGVSTFPKAVDVREAARITPVDRLLLETDCPYLAPVPHRGKRNEPSFVVKTAEVIAKARGTSLDEIGIETTANFKRAFRVESSISSDLPASYT